MSLRRALLFPFRNKTRLLLLALWQCLLCSTPLVFGLYLLLTEERGSLSQVITLVLFAFIATNVLWLHGYSVGVLRNIFDGNDRPPPVFLAEYLRDGIRLLFSTAYYSVLWALTAFVAIVAVAVLNKLVELLCPDITCKPLMSLIPIHELGTLLALGLVFACLIFKIILKTAYDLGVARYAAAGRLGALYELKAHATIARQNLRMWLWHLICQGILAGLYLLLAIIAVEIGHVLGRHTELTAGEGPQALAMTVGAILLLVTGYMSYWLSSSQLFAQYAMRTGIGANPRKQKPKRV